VDGSLTRPRAKLVLDVAHITPTNDGSLRAPHGTIGNAIKKLREKNGWTQIQLATKIGRTQSAIASYESGRICPSVGTAKLLAIALNVPIEFILAHRRALFTRDVLPTR
jgi:DNA-binding XRE family transcriptional regulator